MCQCPSTGLHHFYDLPTGKRLKASKSVNALQRAYIISTSRYADKILELFKVSMPFNGLTSFLPVYAQNNYKNNDVCQCPSTGLHHFYYKTSSWLVNGSVMCQCPSTGLHHFYKIYCQGWGRNTACVNAL